MSSPRLSPGVHFPPPLLFAAGLAAAWWLHRQYPLTLMSGNDGLRLLGGWFLLLQGLVLLLAGLATLFLNRTGIYPNQPASAIVQTGPYRFTRNPMYLALAISHAGIAMLANTLWALVLLPVVILVLHITVIRREERYLQEAFGAVYADYCRRVRRWF